MQGMHEPLIFTQCVMELVEFRMLYSRILRSRQCFKEQISKFITVITGLVGFQDARLSVYLSLEGKRKIIFEGQDLQR